MHCLLVARRGRHDGLATPINLRLFIFASLACLFRTLRGISSFLNLPLDFLLVFLLVVVTRRGVSIRSVLLTLVVLIAARLTDQGLFERYFSQGLRFLHFHLLHHLPAGVHVCLVRLHLLRHILLRRHATHLLLNFLSLTWLDEGRCTASRRRPQSPNTGTTWHALIVSRQRRLILHELIECQLVRLTAV